MKKMFLLFAVLLFISSLSFSQSNCSNPGNLIICPTINLANQTNAGMGDDAPANCNVFGEDLVYSIAAPNGANVIFVSIANATTVFRLSILTASCSTGTSNSRIVASGNSNVYFNVPSVSNYYLWIDAPVSFTFDISIGADTNQTWVSIPNLQGNLYFDTTCTANAFNNNKPFFEVAYNNVFQFNPMTLSPLFTTGSMCITTFFQNPTGIEAVKRFEFEFNPQGYTSVNAPASIPSTYLPGNWISTVSGSKWTYTFSDSLSTGQGDFSGTPNTCLAYKFCFDVLPVTNDSMLTDVKVRIYTDGRGAGFNGWVSQGCCPVPNANCFAGPGGGAGVNSFGYGFTDPGPGSPLPIELIYFSAKAIESVVYLNWTTASETNNDFFTIEKSKNGNDWNELRRIEGSGNSTITNSYELSDENPFSGSSYYRLKQNDYDGNYSYSELQRVYISKSVDLFIYPNPAYESITIEGSEMYNYQYFLFNSTGEKIKIESIVNQNKININTSALFSGIYLLIVSQDGIVLAKEKIIVK